MANKTHLQMLKLGVQAWNDWRRRNPNIEPDLSRANLKGETLINAYLSEVNFSKANLFGANLYRANLFKADLSYVNLSRAYLSDANLDHTNLSYARLAKTWLSGAKIHGTNFFRANLREANLRYTYISYANFSEADFSLANIGWTTFGDTDLSEIKGLNFVHHLGPSTIGIDTLYRSNGKIPDKFLKGCGVPNDFITYIPSLVRAEQAIQFHSCFISYSHKDEEFTKRLYSRLSDSEIRVWYAPEDVKGGEKLHEQIDRAIQIHDKLLIVLSENSLQSEWVMTEIRKARRTEIKEKRRKLFPIRLVEYETLRDWECFDSEIGNWQGSCY